MSHNHTYRSYADHGYIGHTYVGHVYIGHNHLGHSYIGHNCMGHNYMGHNYNPEQGLSKTDLLGDRRTHGPLVLIDGAETRGNVRGNVA